MRRLLPILLILGSLVLVGHSLLVKSQKTGIRPSQIEVSNVPNPPEDSKFTARFEIYTEGTKRIFTDPKHHHQSESVFIQDPDPSIVNVRRAGITWSDFFSTLPFKLEKECLLTGTGQTFCNTETQRLHFTLNGVETPDALDLKIMPEDSLIVEYY